MGKNKIYIISTSGYDFSWVRGVFTNKTDAEIFKRAMTVMDEAEMVDTVIEDKPASKTYNFEVNGKSIEYQESFHPKFTLTDEKPSKFEFSAEPYPHDPKYIQYRVSGVVSYNTDEDPYDFRRRIENQIIDEFRAWKAESLCR